MIATKTTALMMALGMLGIASMMFVSPSVVYAQNTNVAANSGENEDNDDVEQENKSEIKQKSKNDCESSAGSANIAGVAVGDQTSTATSVNDCDSTQAAVVTQSNTNTDNDVQFNVQEADAEQSVCESFGLLLGLNICDNELEAAELDD